MATPRGGPATRCRPARRPEGHDDPDQRTRQAGAQDPTHSIARRPAARSPQRQPRDGSRPRGPAAQSAHVRRGPLHRDRQAGAHSGGAQDRGTGQAPGAPDHGGAHHRPRTRCGAAGGSGCADRPPGPGAGAGRQPGRRTRSGLGSGRAAAARTGGRGPGGLLDPRGVCPAPRPGGAGGATRREPRAGPAHHDHDPARRRVPTRPPPPRVRGRDGGDGCRPDQRQLFLPVAEDAIGRFVDPPRVV